MESGTLRWRTIRAVAAPDKPDFAFLDAARQPIIDAFSDRGVEGLDYVAGFAPPYDFAVWLQTETDAQRDALQADPGLEADVGAHLQDAGLWARDLLRRVVVQSQETVDRDCEGSWFYAMR